MLWVYVDGCRFVLFVRGFVKAVLVVVCGHIVQRLGNRSARAVVAFETVRQAEKRKLRLLCSVGLVGLVGLLPPILARRRKCRFEYE